MVDKFFCVPANENCPIVSFGFTDVTSIPSDAETVQIDSTSSLWFTRKYND